MNDSVKSASRILDILEFFSSTTELMGVTEVAKRLDIPKSSTQALLLTLTARGYLARDESNYYLPEELRGGWVGGARTRLLGVSNPAMERAVEATGESAFLGVLTPTFKVQYLAKISSPSEIRYDASLSPLRPVHCTSIGLAILAHQVRYTPDSDPLQAFTPHTITDPKKIALILTAAKKNGYAEVKDGHVEGASGVSAPIFDSTGKVIAALNIGAPTWRYERNRERLISVVLNEAKNISTSLCGASA